MKSGFWIKPTVILVVLFLLGKISPSNSIDPWNLFSPKRIVNLIFALAFIQALGSLSIWLLGTRIGAIFSGFLGGLVSSTATTASLARKSSLSKNVKKPPETLSFLSATLAMLLEALAITSYGAKDVQWNLLILFSGPLLSVVMMIIFYARVATKHEPTRNEAKLEFLPILKLSGFIIAALGLSKILQSAFGQARLLVLTFIVSLFEIHGSVIANLQLHDVGEISAKSLGSFLAVSIIASYTSKLFLVLTMGSSEFKKSVMKSTLILFLSLAVSWTLFNLAN